MEKETTRLFSFIAFILLINCCELVYGEEQENKIYSFSDNSQYHHQIYTAEEIVVFKTILGTFGYELNTESDDWDKNTDDAVRAFQRDHLLKQDGRIGPKTLGAMAKVLQGELVTTALKPESKIPLGLYSSPRPPEVRRGDMLKVFDFETGEFRNGRVVSILGDTVQVSDRKTGEVFYIHLKDIK